MARTLRPAPGPTDIRDLPTEILLASDGDSRHTPETDGRNRYGNAYRPEDGLLTFGSCTASTVSTEAFAAAHRLHGWLGALDGEQLERAIDDLYEQVRVELVANVAMPIAAMVDVVITPSGTDAEFIALLASLRPGRELTSILVGASEAGSGTALAAGGLHFDTATPAGIPATPGTPVDESIAARVRAVRVGVRGPEGSPRDEAGVDDEVREHARQAISAGRDVLVHVIAHSKTGVHAPSLATVHRLVAAHPGRITAVVDAAQGRFSRRGLRESLTRGYMTITTGSKFFGGPPFAGAVLIPRTSTMAAPTVETMPAGFGAYFTPAMLPRAWASARASLDTTDNLGVLLRWWAALAEIRDYYSVPAQLRLDVLRHAESVFPEAIASSTRLGLDAIEPPRLENDVERLLESKMTVFPFTCRRRDGTLLDAAELSSVQRIMRGRDPASTSLAADLDRLHVELGQPVDLGDQPPLSVLRLALGARQIIRACVISASGSTFAERLDTLADDVRQTVRKLDHVIETIDTSPGTETGP